MSHVRVPFSASIGRLRLTIAAGVATGLIAVGLFVVAAPASADGPTQVNNCSNTLVNLVCVGQYDGDLVTVNVGDINVLNVSQVQAATATLGDVLLSVINVQDINVLAFEINTAVQTWVNTTLNTITTITTKTCAPVVSSVVTPPLGDAVPAITINCS
jgi:hypothetical protein